MYTNRKKSEIDRQRRNRKRLWWSVAIFFGFSILLSFFFGDTGLLGYLRMQQKRSQLIGEIEYLKKQNDLLRGEVKALRQNPDYIEGIARDRLGLIREGEMVYQFEKDTPDATDSKPTH
jgi:cell division protein FtsB